MWGLVMGIIVLVLYLGFVWFGSKPYVHHDLTIEDLPKHFDILLSRGELGGQMFVQATMPEQNGVLPFIKYGGSGGNGIRFAMPRVSGSEAFFDDVVSKVRNGGFPLREAPPSEEEPRLFAFVNLGMDVREATRLAEVALDRGESAQLAVKVWYRNVGAGPWRSKQPGDG